MAVTRAGKVVKLEDVLVKQKKTATVKPGKAKSKPKEKAPPSVPRGKPKSGRVWKNERTRFSSIVKTRGIRSSVAKKQALRQELARVKQLSRAVKDAKTQEKVQKKERRRENMKRQEENRKRSEVVQVIKNPSKIKKMKKKHLRHIEKRDTTKVA